jgi:chromosomal replication initiator protein
MSPDALAVTLWNNVLAEIRQHVTEQQFDTWFRSLRPGRSSEDAFELTAQNSFAREWVRSRFSDVILAALEKVTGGRRPALRFVVREETQSTATPLSDAESEVLSDTPEATERVEAAAPARTNNEAAAQGQRSGLALNRDFRFRSFVSGPSNRVAVAAAQSVVDRGARLYNPLCIHGGVGTGKTHLLQAMAHGFLDRNPAQRVLWVTAEHFVNLFIAALEKGSVDGFRARFRDVDVLIVDDMQFFGNKERTQEEFLHTFNALHNAGRQIIMSCDREPSQMEGLNERLRSRLAGGFVCALEAPDYEVRLGLVRARAQRLGVELPEESAAFIAEHVRTNARELEGAVTRVAGQAFLGSQRINTQLVRDVLKDVVTERRRRVAFDHIARAVEEHYGVRLQDLQGKRRTQAIAVPRQVGMILARKLTGHSLEEIGHFFGGRDHSTVSYSIDKAEKQAGDDGEFREVVERLAARAMSIAAS